MRVLLCLFLLAAWSCSEPDDQGGGPLPGDGFIGDPEQNNEMGQDPTPDVSPTPDAAPDPAPEPTPDTEPDPSPEMDPCQGVDCGANSQCLEGECVCDEGFERRGQQCLPIDPTDPAQRSAELVCQRWLEDYPERASQTSTGVDAANCVEGSIDPTAHEDAMRRLNLFRWLLGLEPAGEDAEAKRITQKAALMMDVNNSLSHSPPSDWTCFSQEGADAAGSSNLGLGYRSAAATLDGYIRDGGTPSLGHRRWCFFPQLDAVGFGHVGRGGAMRVFGRNNNPAVPFVAYPGPGPWPIEGLLGVWSFSSNQLASDATVTVRPRSTGQNIVSRVDYLQQGFGLNTVAITLSQAVSAGEVYEVEVVSGGATHTYETTIVSCQ